MRLADIATDPLLLPIWVPIAAGLVVWLIPRPAAALGKLIAVLATLFAAVWGVLVWTSPARLGVAAVKLPEFAWAGSWAGRPLFGSGGGLDPLSSFAGAAAGVLAFLVTLYAVGHGDDEGAPARRLYSGMLLSIGATFGCLYAEDLWVLAVLWGFVCIPFFLLLALGPRRDDSASSAKKAFIIVGGTDSLLILGIGIVWYLTGGRVAMHELAGQPISTGGNALTTVACAAMLAAALAKAGAVPFHSWIPDAAASAPVPAVALLPASLDKILGIYLVARISLTIFAMSGYLSTLLMILGAVTIVAAVFMALIQHDLRKLLGFHAVSQVGYMILGIGTGTFIGIAGGLFHLLNNTIYKTALFLTAGTVERKEGTGELGELGGMAKALPFTFISASIAALAISGVPPLNGFVSKWMVYQGLVETGRRGSYLWLLLLAAATFGSALTLASFVKVIYSVYLGPRPAEREKPPGRGESVLTALPVLVLAAACVVLGVAAFTLPLERAIFPAVLGTGVSRTDILGLWEPGIATVLILAGIAAGFVIYLAGTAMKPREDSTYVGGEVEADLRFGGPDFYETVGRIPPLPSMYPRAMAGLYDLYQWAYELVQYAGKGLQALHSGVVYRYVTWTVLGAVLLLWILLR